jgi:hypothetical protein
LASHRSRGSVTCRNALAAVVPTHAMVAATSNDTPEGTLATLVVLVTQYSAMLSFAAPGR